VARRSPSVARRPSPAAAAVEVSRADSGIVRVHTMSRYAETPRVAMQVSRNVVVASIQVDLDDDVLALFQQDLLNRVHERDSRGVILDVSGLETLDAHEFAALRRTMSMVTIMGTESVLVGLQPGVVSALIEMGADVEGLRTAIDLDAAFALLEPELTFQPESESESRSEQDSTGASADASSDVRDDIPPLGPTREPVQEFGEER
jgi:rsbT antagonist protein RsbS